MVKRHIIAFDAGGTAVKAALYDESGRECAVASVTMATLPPAPGFLERDPEAMWAAICLTTRKVLQAAAVAPSSIAVVGLQAMATAFICWTGMANPRAMASSPRISAHKGRSRAGARRDSRPASSR